MPTATVDGLCFDLMRLMLPPDVPAMGNIAATLANALVLFHAGTSATSSRVLVGSDLVALVEMRGAVLAP